MNKQIFKFKDSLCIAQPTNKAARDDAMGMIERNSKTALKVTIDATHSGVKTNQRVYPGGKVSQGYRSFFSREKGGTAEFDKPVLKHHDDISDPIGRIVGARYTAYKVGQEFDLDFLNPDPYGSRGSGVVTVDALITDPDSIKKIIDGRFVSVSSGHNSDAAFCSICGDSIMECSHLPGKRYDADGEVSTDEDARDCFVITNNMTYNELSFVNMPAQPPAKLINFNWADCKDYSEKSNVLVESTVNASKDLVRVFSLVDADDELNLLTGKRKSEGKKTIIAVKPAVADKLTAALSKPKTPNDDDQSVRPQDKGNKVEQPETNLKANSNPKEGDLYMDPIELQKKIDSLEGELRVAKTKITEFETAVKAKDSDIQRLSDESKRLVEDSKKLDLKMRKTLATSLVGLKVRLKKSDAANLDSKEKVDQLVEKLSARSTDSLEDAVSDLMLEVESLKPETKQDKAANAADLLNADRVEDPTLQKGAKPGQSKSKQTNIDTDSTVDLIDRELGL